MKRKTKAWKVIDRHDRRSVDQPDGYYAVTYHKNRWTRPALHGSRLFVFKRKKDAEKAMANNWGERARLVRCEVLDARPEEKISSLFAPEAIKRWWVEGKCNWPAPFNTLGATAVKCLQ